MSGPAIAPPEGATKDELRRLATEAWEREQRRKAEEAKPKAPPKLTLEWHLYEETREGSSVRKGWAPKTCEMYEDIYDNWIRGTALGRKPVDEITTADARAWVDTLIEGKLAGASIDRYIGCVKASLNRARGRKVDNPFTGITGPKKDASEGEPDYKRILTRDELDRFLALPWSPRMKLAVLILSHGLRQSEALGVRYEDFDGMGIRIQRQAQEAGKGKQHVRGLKTKRSRRYMPVGPELAALLCREKKGYVLVAREGNPMRNRQLLREWDRMLGRGIDPKTKEPRTPTEWSDMTPHDLRSTCASLLLQDRQNSFKDICDMLGMSLKVLLEIYARSYTHSKAEAMQRFWNRTTEDCEKAA